MLALGFAASGFVDSVTPKLGGVEGLIGLALTTPDLGIAGCPITPDEPPAPVKTEDVRAGSSGCPYEVGGGFADLGFAGTPEIVLEFESPTGNLRLDGGTALSVSDLDDAGGR